MSIEFRVTDPFDDVARDLVGRMEAEMFELYEGLDLNDPTMPSASPALFAAPAGCFLVGRDEDQPVACGGFKPLPDDGACEVKRMYVTPSARGGGVATQLLTALEDYARSAGYRIVRLDTGPRQPEVAQMYRRRGYRDIPNFNNNPKATYFGEKSL